MKGVISFDSHELSSVSIHLKDLLKDTLRYHPNKVNLLIIFKEDYS
jgi:hypothetical protein